MKILFIAPFFPWPLAHGGRIRLYHLLRELSCRHEVTLVCLSEERDPDLGELKRFCHRVVPVFHKSQFIPSFWRFLTGPFPYNAVRFHSPLFYAQISELIGSKSFDLVHLETTHIWFASSFCGDLPLVLGTQNIEANILSQIRQKCRNPLKRLLYRLETDKMCRYEEAAWKSCDLCLAVSDAERQEMIACGVSADRVVVVPNGVDLQRFVYRRPTGGKRLLFLAGLDYLPNRDAALWMLTEIWPLIRSAEPSAGLILAGRGTQKLAEVGLPAGVSCIGDPADVPDCFASADMLLVPLRIGGGTRLKVLEGMAGGLPIVATSKGCEGVGAVDGEQLLVADSPKEFAAACLRIMAEPLLAEALAKKGRHLVEERYGWEPIAGRLSTIYESLLHCQGGAR